MVIDAFESVHTLLDLLRRLDKSDTNKGIRIDETYKVSSLLVPRWQNYLATHADYYDRYPEMVSHGSGHIANMCTLTAEIIVTPVRESLSDKKDEEELMVNNAELFLLIAGLFFHDLGMSVTDQIAQSLHQIRKMHSNYSAKFIDRCFAQRYSLSQQDPGNLFPNASLWTEHDIEVLKKLCIHHQSSAPLTEAEFERMRQEELKGEGKKLSVDAPLSSYIHAHAFDKIEVDHHGKKRTIERVEFLGKPVDLLFLAALLRIIDAMDMQYSRLGPALYTRSSVENIRRQIDNLKKERDRLEETHAFLKEQKGKVHEYLEKEKDRINERIGFLEKQIPEHFTPHASIEKVWFVSEDDRKTYTVIFSTPDKVADSLFLWNIKETDTDPEDQQDKLRCELCEELGPVYPESEKDTPTSQAYSACLDLYGHEIPGNGLAELLDLRGMKIKLPPQKFDPRLHKNRIFELKQFGEKWNYVPGPPNPFLNSSKDDEQIAGHIHDSIKRRNGGDLYIFIGPEGAGKTTFSRSIANYLLKNSFTDGEGKHVQPSICYIACEGMKRREEREELENIGYLIKKFVFFLASQGDFLFYNLLRSNITIDESYWKSLFAKLNSPAQRKNPYVFIFDDIHLLSRAEKSSLTYRFLDTFFTTVTKKSSPHGKATVLLFSRKMPAMLDFDEENEFLHVQPLPGLSEEDVRKAFSRKYLGSEIVQNQELKQPILETLSEYRKLPVILDYIRREESRIAAAQEKNNPVRVKELIRDSMQRHIKNEVYGKIGTGPDKKLVHHLYYYPVSEKSYKTLEQFFGDQKKLRVEFEEMTKRALLLLDEDRDYYQFARYFVSFIVDHSKIPRISLWWIPGAASETDVGSESSAWFEFLRKENPPSSETESTKTRTLSNTLRSLFLLDFDSSPLPIDLPGRPELLLFAALKYEQQTRAVKEDTRRKDSEYTDEVNDADPLEKDERRYVDFLVQKFPMVEKFVRETWKGKSDETGPVEELIKVTSTQHELRLHPGSDSTSDLLWLCYAYNKQETEADTVEKLRSLAAEISRIKEKNPQITERKIVDGKDIMEAGKRLDIEWTSERMKKIGRIKKYLEEHHEELELHSRYEVAKWLEEHLIDFMR